ncbi:Golgi-associated PDZ and coiled-coil motif-containing protein [Araneus ventricosus]|uniref:Golgi-associated PDZ and coiled-coil motif-containing protein n=1 Tax=Araneus ventricosus TaxID=182803 RepID=A0A4Y2UFS7_ARAVE|nr:Golgi-associated PDZ and coiled-coil motif-containing protein [Araneus ventricosus]GBO11797.1 Golgi-associated PDZ and coiled-coil motif-containing protein [Araneus ventricosus]GBO11912.1 Golgi-associated PDZ and coiled-coil motif-containing protein [Araneus ventricosus]GBO11919.1 Golgi-associated PDZ and coiled-coil motif-containing protein [Araneus ventricosus]
MAIGTTGIQWLDLLESEFDKSFVDLDMLIGEVDEDQIEIIYAARQKLTALSTAFAQLSHKSQVVFENSMKLEDRQLFAAKNRDERTFVLDASRYF